MKSYITVAPVLKWLQSVPSNEASLSIDVMERGSAWSELTTGIPFRETILKATGRLYKRSTGLYKWSSGQVQLASQLCI